MSQAKDSFDGYSDFLNILGHWAITGYIMILPGKYPLAEEVLLKCLSREKFDSARAIHKIFTKIEEPDLLIYKPDFSEIRFAESKRLDSHDKLRESQIRGLILLSVLFGCTVDVFEIVGEGKKFDPQPIVWEF